MRWRRPRLPPEGPLTTIRQLTERGACSFSSAVYQANEDAGQFAVTVERTDNLSGPETVYYGVTNKSSEAGINFDKIPNSKRSSPPGRVVHLQRDDPRPGHQRADAHCTRLPLWRPSTSAGHAQPGDHRPAAERPAERQDPQNPLGYPQAPTDGDPLQYVNWYIFGRSRLRARRSASSRTATPPGRRRCTRSLTHRVPVPTASGCGISRSAPRLDSREVPGRRRDRAAEHDGCAQHILARSWQPARTPKAIKNRFENWITQLAHGIGNFRVVLYLEEDSLIETHCLTTARSDAPQELAYAVKRCRRTRTC